MLRWAVVCLVISLVGAALVGVRKPNQRDPLSQLDQIVAYEVGSGRSVTVEVPAGLAEIEITAWGVVDAHPSHSPASLYHFYYTIELYDASKALLLSRPYEYASRISGDPRSPTLERQFAARLTAGSDWVTDPRTSNIDTRQLFERGGQLRMVVDRAQQERILARFTYRAPRGSVGEQLYANSLSPEQRRQFVENKSAMGFADLAPRARSIALNAWGRRLAAVGHLGVDYTEARLLISDFRTPFSIAENKTFALALAPNRLAVLNFSRPVTLRLSGAPGTELGVAELPGVPDPEHELASRLLASERHVIPSSGQLELVLPLSGPKSVVLASLSPSLVYCSLPLADLSAQIGEVSSGALLEERAEISADVRVHHYFRLHPEQPVVFSQENWSAEPWLFSIRGVLEQEPAPPITRAGLSVEWWSKGQLVGRSQLWTELRPSLFDRFRDLGPSTEAQVEQGFLPQDVDEVRMFGDPRLAVGVSVREPGVLANELTAPYRIPLSENIGFEHGPLEVAKWTRLRPDNQEALLIAKRQLDLLAQVRLIDHGITSANEKQLAEAALLPLGTPLSRRVLLPTEVVGEQGNQFARVHGERRLLVRKTGPQANSVKFFYQAEPSRLGEVFSVRIDGVERFRRRLTVSSGSGELEVASGGHEFEVQGLGESGLAFFDAVAESPEMVVRRLTLYELSNESTLSFSVAQLPRTLSSVWFYVTTEGKGVPFSIWYSIDGGVVQHVKGGFFRRATEVSGYLKGKSGEWGSAMLWEGALPAMPSEPFEDGVARVKIELGDDLKPGVHTIRLKLPQAVGYAQRVWLRAIQVGQGLPARAARGRAWKQETAL